MIVVAIKFRDFSLLNLLDKGFTSFVIDFVVLKLELLQSVTLLHKLSNHLRTTRCDLIISKNKSLQLLLLLIRKSCYNNLNTLITDMVTCHIQYSNSLRVSKSWLELFHTLKTDIIAFKTQNFKILLVLQSFTKRSRTVREHTVIRKPHFLNILCRF